MNNLWKKMSEKQMFLIHFITVSSWTVSRTCSRASSRTSVSCTVHETHSAVHTSHHSLRVHVTHFSRRVRAFVITVIVPVPVIVSHSSGRGSLVVIWITHVISVIATHGPVKISSWVREVTLEFIFIFWSKRMWNYFKYKEINLLKWFIRPLVSRKGSRVNSLGAETSHDTIVIPIIHSYRKRCN